MAQQATVKRAAADPPEAPKRGRPQGAKTRPLVERMQDRRYKTYDYTKWKLTFQKSADFDAYLAGYPDKTGIMGYLYRLKPRIDLSLIGIEDAHIHQTSAETELNEEFISTTFGRGVYMLTLIDANRPKGQTEKCRTFFDCSLAQKAPQYDPRSLCLGDQKNQDEINRLLNAGVLIRDPHSGAPRLKGEYDGPAAAPAAPAATNGGGDQFGREFMNTVVMGLLNRANPHDAVKDTIEMARLLKNDEPKVDVETIVERVVTRLNGAGPAARPGDIFSQYERMDAFLDRFRAKPVTGVVLTDHAETAGGSSFVGNASSWVPHVPGILAEARGFVTDLFSGLAQFRGTPPPEAAQPGGQAVQQQRPVLTMQQRVEEVARMGFQKMLQGVAGFDYAAWVCLAHPGGLEVYQALEPMGTMGVIGMAAMNPATQAFVSDPEVRPQLEKFLDAFFTFDPSGGVESSPGAAVGS